MRRAALVLLALLAASPVAAATQLGLVTGPAHGTSHQLGLDLIRLVKPAGIELRVYPSRGSVDNLAALGDGATAQLGIVQSDVLDFIGAGGASPIVAGIARQLRVAAFEQLSGKRIAIGAEGSGTYVTARRLLKLADVQPREVVTLDAEQALGRLKKGQLDAIIYVAPSPLSFLKETVGATDGLALVPITSKSVREWYAGAELPARTYAWQPAPVATVAVRAVLVAVDSEGPRCEAIGRFAQTVAAGLPWLRAHGHARWQDVDIGRRVEGWPQSECARRAGVIGVAPRAAARAPGP
jgi:TRAP-type uncharacterized transport system substrate-binding protein